MPFLKSDAFDVIVVGVSFYQKALEKICGDRREEGIELHVQAKIIPYDNNPYDANAVRIEIEDEIVGHLSRKSASIWRSKMISDGLSGAVTCPAIIIWNREYYTSGNYAVWLDIDLNLPDSKPEIKSENTVFVVPTNQSNSIEFLVNELNRFELLNCKVGDEVNLWEANCDKQIFIYRQGTDFGEGKIGICPDSVCDILLAAAGWDASIASIYDGGCKISCKFLTEAEMAERCAKSEAEIAARKAERKAEKLAEMAARKAEKLKVQGKGDKLRNELDANSRFLGKYHAKYLPKKD